MDATYYALPMRQMTELWVERTPDDFVFDIKAHALMTGHPTETKRLPKELRESLPKALAGKVRLYATDLPGELMDRVWDFDARDRLVAGFAAHGAGHPGRRHVELYSRHGEL